MRKPPFDITEKTIEYISSISEKVGKITEHSGLDGKPHLRKNNRLRSIHSSLSIEANSLSIGEVQDVIAGKKVKGDAKEILEIKNAYSAYEGLSEINPYSIDELLKYHALMTDGLVEEAGKFRKGEEGVFDGDRCIFMAPPAKLVPGLMEDLFSWMNEAKGSLHPLMLSAVFHYEFVFIHPFSDGNGRMARLWHTAILKEWKEIFEFVPIESQIEKFQQEYYDAISRCHASGNSNAFIEFMLERIDEVLDKVLEQSKNQIYSSIRVNKLLTIMEEGVPYTPVQLQDKLGLKSRNALKQNYVNPAIEEGFVYMELEDKPKSKNQRYIKKW